MDPGFRFADYEGNRKEAQRSVIGDAHFGIHRGSCGICSRVPSDHFVSFRVRCEELHRKQLKRAISLSVADGEDNGDQ